MILGQFWHQRTMQPGDTDRRADSVFEELCGSHRCDFILSCVCARVLQRR
jgi:hypothetical protein